MHKVKFLFDISIHHLLNYQKSKGDDAHETKTIKSRNQGII